jgi:dihydroorotase
MKLLIKNADIINHDGRKKADILCEKGLIVKIGKNIKADDAKVIDAEGKPVFPGFIDLHVHFRTPGREDKETIESGSKAAVKGGFTTVMCMPNTTPAIDTFEVANSIKQAADSLGLLDVIPVGSFTKGRDGKELSDIGLLKEAGCRALSDDGCSVANAQVFRRALEYAKKFDLVGICHCEEHALAQRGVIRECEISAKWGIPGIPSIAESIIVGRDIEIAQYLDVPLHFAHISTKRSVELIRRAKAEGVKVTAETAPHYLTLTIEDIEKGSFDSRFKVNPPIGDAADQKALIKGLKDGTIDCISTDHAPHTKLDKEGTFVDSAFGLIGLETSFALMHALVEKETLSYEDLARVMSFNPARVVGLTDRGEIAEGKRADLCIVDPSIEWTVTEEDIVSKSKNTPFLGRTMRGAVVSTVFGGKVVYKA